VNIRRALLDPLRCRSIILNLPMANRTLRVPFPAMPPGKDVSRLLGDIDLLAKRMEFEERSANSIFAGGQLHGRAMLNL
jgi:hypothetical protein